MNSLKVDSNRNNTILEVSGDDFDLNSGEFQVESDYDFPTGQPVIYYRWNGDQSSGYVEVNSEATIKTFYAQAGTLTGLDLVPYVNSVIGGDFLPNTTKTVEILGENFSSFSNVEISGDGNFVNTINFNTPKKLTLEITVNDVEGIYNLTIINSELTSDSSGYGKIVVKSKNIVDLRTIPINDMGLELTSDISVEQDVLKGVSFHSKSASWNRGIKFTTYFWNRNDDITFEVIFTRTSDVNFMVGIGSSLLNTTNINSAYYKQEIGMFHNNNKLSSMYGGGDVSNWSQGVGTNIIFDVNKFYKLKLENSGGEGARCSILEVNIDDWDDENELHSWISTCPSDDIILVPFIVPQAASGAYYITGFRF